MTRLQEYALTLLENLMSEISEDHYAAGWNGGLEFDLWRIVQGGNPSYGMNEVSPENIALLKQYSDDIGGWFNGERFFTHEEWAEQYIEYLKQRVEEFPAYIEWTRRELGKKDFIGRLTTQSDVDRALANFETLKSELNHAMTHIGKS